MALTKTQPLDGGAPVQAQPLPAATASAPVTASTSFESMEETVKGATPAANDEPPAAAASGTAAQSSVPAAAPTGTALVTKAEAGKFKLEVEAMKGAADFAYGNYPVYKGLSGSIMGTGETDTNLGSWIQVSMVGWDDRVQISPGSDTELAKGAVAYSKDGVFIDNVIDKSKYGAWEGKAVKDYVEFLRGQDYVDASVSRYVDIACVVLDGQKKAAKDMAGEVICVCLSQTSIPSFSAYQEALKIKAKAIERGIKGVKLPQDPFTFFFVAIPTKKDDMNWTKLRVTDRQPTDD